MLQVHSSLQLRCIAMSSTNVRKAEMMGINLKIMILALVILTQAMIAMASVSGYDPQLVLLLQISEFTIILGVSDAYLMHSSAK